MFLNESIHPLSRKGPVDCKSLNLTGSDKNLYMSNLSYETLYYNPSYCKEKKESLIKERDNTQFYDSNRHMSVF